MESQTPPEPERAGWLTAENDHITRARQLEAARRIQAGEISVPLACGWCNSPSVISIGSSEARAAWKKGAILSKSDPTDLRCVACGRLTTLFTARKLRRGKLVAIIRRGVDIDVTRPSRALHTNRR